MKISVRFFASIREQLGCTAEKIAVPDNVQNVGDLRRFLIDRGGIWQETLSFEKPVRMACRLEMASETTELNDGDEVAFFPPVTGG